MSMAPSMNSRRILVAEDNDAARHILSDLVRMMGYEVDAVEHGMAAVEACRSQTYAAVLMDCHMPVLDGLDATRAIRQIRQDDGAQPIIIAVTGDGDPDECRQAGMDDFLKKPVRPPILRATLQRWLAPAP